MCFRVWLTLVMCEELKKKLEVVGDLVCWRVIVKIMALISMCCTKTIENTTSNSGR